jgi:hypothetical protein
MKIQDAVSRLSYTVSKGHKPNETDKIALNKIIHDLNANATETVNEHYLFAKLYAVVLTDFIKHYQDVDFANKQINKELEKPLEHHLAMLRLQLNQMEFANVDPLLTAENYEAYRHLFKDEIHNWSPENVQKHFTNTVNQSILCFKKSL